MEEKRYYATSKGYTLAYWRPKEGGKEGERDQRLIQFQEFPPAKVLNKAGGAVVEQYDFSIFATRDQWETKALDEYIAKSMANGLGPCNVMTEDEFNRYHKTLCVRMDPGAAEVLVDEHNSLLLKLKQFEAKEAMEKVSGGKK